MTSWPWTCVTCCARLWDNFHQVWPSTTTTTYTCLNYSVFYANTLYHAVKLTFDPLRLKVCGTPSVTWSKSVQNLSEIEQFPAELLIFFANFCTRYVTLWLWPWTFTALKMSCVLSVYKIWVKSNNPWLRYWRFSTFSPCNFRGWGTIDWQFSGVRGPNFTKLGRGIGQLFLHNMFVSEFRHLARFTGHDWLTVLRGAWTQLHQTWPRYRAIISTQHVCFRVQTSCCIFKRGRLKLEWCWKRHQISHFLPLPCKN